MPPSRFPGYERSGPFERNCLLDGYWSGREPSCSKPRPPPLVRSPITILNDNTVDGTKNIRAGHRGGDEDDHGHGHSVRLKTLQRGAMHPLIHNVFWGMLYKKLRFETYPRLLTGRYISC